MSDGIILLLYAAPAIFTGISILLSILVILRIISLALGTKPSQTPPTPPMPPPPGPPPIPPPPGLLHMAPLQAEKEMISVKDNEWWNEGIEKNESIKLSSISKSKYKTEIPITETSIGESPISGFLKAVVAIIIFYTSVSILDLLGFPAWEILGIILVLLEILSIFF